MGLFLYKVRVEGAAAVEDGRGGNPVGPGSLDKVPQVFLELPGVPQVGLIGQENPGAVLVQALGVAHLPVHHVVAVVVPKVQVVLGVTGGVVEPPDVAVVR